MLSNNPAEPQASPSCDAESGVSGTPVVSPRNTIEVASEGGGTVNDPGGTDRRPPYTGDEDLLLLA